jgi:hypothetical protein
MYVKYISMLSMKCLYRHRFALQNFHFSLISFSLLVHTFLALSYRICKKILLVSPCLRVSVCLSTRNYSIRRRIFMKICVVTDIVLPCRTFISFFVPFRFLFFFWRVRIEVVRMILLVSPCLPACVCLSLCLHATT